MPLRWIWLVPPEIVATIDSRYRKLITLSVEKPCPARICMPEPGRRHVRLRTLELGHRALPGARLALREQPGRPVGEQPGGVDLGLQVGHRVRERLERRRSDGRTACRCLGVLEHLVERRLGGAHVAAAEERPSLELEVGQHDPPPVVEPADQARPWHHDVVEEDLVGAEDVPGQRRGAPQLDPRRVGSTSRQADAPVLGRRGSGAHVHGMVVSGRPPPVHHIFCPLTTKWSPGRTAVVRSAAASEPASGSLIPTA